MVGGGGGGGGQSLREEDDGDDQDQPPEDNPGPDLDEFIERYHAEVTSREPDTSKQSKMGEN